MKRKNVNVHGTTKYSRNPRQNISIAKDTIATIVCTVKIIITIQTRHRYMCTTFAKQDIFLTVEATSWFKKMSALIKCSGSRMSEIRNEINNESLCHHHSNDVYCNWDRKI